MLKQKKENFLLIFILLGLTTTACYKKYNDDVIDNALIQQTEQLRLQGKIEEVIALNKQYIHIAEQKNYKRGVILGYINIANIYATIGKYKNGILFLNQARDLLKDVRDDYLHMRLYHEYGQINYVMGLVDVALNYNARALAFAQKDSIGQYQKSTQ